jgi:LytR cell envelope-related transcriptional attenuator
MRSWPFLVAVGAISAIAGAAIVGRPTPRDPFVISASLTPPVDETRPADTAVTVPATTTTVAVTAAPSTTLDPAATTLPATTLPATTVAPSTIPVTTIAPTTIAPTTIPTTPPVATTVPGGPGTLERADVRLVVANGDGRFNLATANANRLRAAGYVQIDETDVSNKVDATVIYYRPGFDDEATRAAADLGIPAAITEPLPSTPVTINDSLGDLVIVLGPDALR